MTTSLTRFGSMLAGLLALGAAAAFAADTGGPVNEPPTPVCPKGYVFSAQTQKCVKLRKGAADDESLYAQGRRLAKLGRYEDALAVLALIERQDDPRVLNYIGYSHRRLGDVETGLAYYQRALALDPNDTLVREYLGEAYVQMGRLDLATEQLREIEARCGTTCEPYEDLAEAIAKAETRG